MTKLYTSLHADTHGDLRHDRDYWLIQYRMKQESDSIRKVLDEASEKIYRILRVTRESETTRRPMSHAVREAEGALSISKVSPPRSCASDQEER